MTTSEEYSNEIILRSSKELRCDYVVMWELINEEMKSIYGIAHMLALLRRSPEETVDIDAEALGDMFYRMEQSVLAVWGHLDDFMPVIAVRRSLTMDISQKVTLN